MKFVNIMALYAVLPLVACTNTVGNNAINDKGEFTNDSLDWPVVEDASSPEGIFPNAENLEKIASGVTKKDLYYLIKRPHFQETKGAREWNYIMKFRQSDQSVKICQYKILFDKEGIARNFYWLPEDCMTNEDISLSADATFAFGQGRLTDLKRDGRESLDKLAKYVLQKGNVRQIAVTGYTDHLGSPEYNLRLSKQRAKSVKQYLIDQGVLGSRIQAKGRGEASPVVLCNDANQKNLIRCLSPNRRVEIRLR